MWPTPQDYNEAVQSPDFAFVDDQLRASIPELTALGLPKPVSGSFASVYQMRGENGNHWAVRCFLRNVPKQEERYAAISAHLARYRLPFMVPFEFLRQGIRVNGAWFPILKMQWVTGTPLIDWIQAHLEDAAALIDLQESWTEMCRELAASGIAHGDFQHGNVFVGPDCSLKLVDYDGLYVPALASMGSAELGHRHYQHPQRSSKDFGPYLDNFSAWSIWASLHCLQQDSRIWHRLGGGDECLVFKQEDYVDPSQSVAFSFLEQHDSGLVRETSRTLRRLLAVKPQEVPPLGEPIAGVWQIQNMPPLALPPQVGDASKSPAEVLVNLRIAVAAAKAPTLVASQPDIRLVEVPDQPVRRSASLKSAGLPPKPPSPQSRQPVKAPRHSTQSGTGWKILLAIGCAVAVPSWQYLQSHPDKPPYPSATVATPAVSYQPGKYAIIDDLGTPLSKKLQPESFMITAYETAYKQFKQKHYAAAQKAFTDLRTGSSSFSFRFDQNLCDYMTAKCLIAQKEASAAIPILQSVRAACAKDKFWIPTLACDLAQAQISVGSPADAIETIVLDVPLSKHTTVFGEQMQVLREASLSAMKLNMQEGYDGYYTFIAQLDSLHFPDLQNSVYQDLTKAAEESKAAKPQTRTRILKYTVKLFSTGILSKYQNSKALAAALQTAMTEPK